jgi:release factor glutamine methyltransferase
VVAVEASAAALVVARRNAIKHALDIEFRHGRWLDAVAGERFELIVSNPPYVPADDPHLADLGYEPREALVAGADGLDAIREIVLAAPAHLDRLGWLLVEHAMGQDGAVREMLSTGGLEDVQSWPDLAGIARVSGGKR